MRGPKMTLATMKVLSALLDDPAGQHYGLELGKSAGVLGGSLYPILSRLEAAEWIVGEWEEIDERAAGRRRRRYYTLTPDGVAEARSVISETVARLSWRPAFSDMVARLARLSWRPAFSDMVARLARLSWRPA